MPAFGKPGTRIKPVFANELYSPSKSNSLRFFING
jgi:hypothetical protein